MRLLVLLALATAGGILALPNPPESRDIVQNRAAACPAAGAPFHIKAGGGTEYDGYYLTSGKNAAVFPRYISKNVARATSFMLTAGGNLIRKNTSGKGPGYYYALILDSGNSGQPSPAYIYIDRKNNGQYYDYVLCKTVESANGCELNCSVQTKALGLFSIEYVCNDDIGGNFITPAVGDTKNNDPSECIVYQMLVEPVS